MKKKSRVISFDEILSTRAVARCHDCKEEREISSDTKKLQLFASGSAVEPCGHCGGPVIYELATLEVIE